MTLPTVRTTSLWAGTGGRVGHHDKAIDYLEQLLTVPTLFAAPFLKADPTWLPLRDNPPFRALLEQHMPSPT